MTFICGRDAAPVPVLEVLAQLRECCFGATEGPENCTCWEPVYDLDQSDELQRDAAIVTRHAMCDDCAYRPDSPERTGQPIYRDAEDLEDAVRRGTFWCHQGMRKPRAWRHATLGIEVPAAGDFYEPPIVKIGDEAVPFKADGTPGERCAGWAARRQVATRESVQA